MRSVSPTTGRWTGYEVSVTSEPDSNVMRLVVDGPNEEAVEALTRSVRDEGSVVLDQLFSIFVIESLSSADPSAELVSLPWTRIVAFAVILGLGLGALIAVWFDSLMLYRQSSRSPAGGTRSAAGQDRDRGASAPTIATLNRQ
jgi:capsular polysaccharide biosynthesis protein